MPIQNGSVEAIYISGRDYKNLVNQDDVNTNAMYFIHPQENQSDSKAYAILISGNPNTYTGDFVIFRSYENYEMTGNIDSYTDILGNTYTGLLFTDPQNYENPNWTPAQPTWMGTQYIQYIRNVYVAPGQDFYCKSLYYMFRTCSYLTSIDFSGFVGEITGDCTGFLYGTSLQVVDMTSLNMPHCKSYASMFSGSTVSKVTLPYIEVLDRTEETQQYVNFGSMFYGCLSLIEVDASNVRIRTGGLIRTWQTFTNCSNLTTVYASTNWVDYMNSQALQDTQLFYNCQSIQAIYPYSEDQYQRYTGPGPNYACINRYTRYTQTSPSSTGEVGYFTFKYPMYVSTSTNPGQVITGQV